MKLDQNQQDELQSKEHQQDESFQRLHQYDDQSNQIPSPDISNFIEYWTQTEKLNQDNVQKKQQEESYQGYQYPSQSKNNPKNKTKALQKFIHKNCSHEIKQKPQIIQFLRMKDFKKNDIQNLIRSNQLLRQISNQFFGNFQWAREFVQNNKTDLSQHFRLNQQWFKKKKK